MEEFLDLQQFLHNLRLWMEEFPDLQPFLQLWGSGVEKVKNYDGS